MLRFFENKHQLKGKRYKKVAMDLDGIQGA
jgi:hypothetical protein